MRKLIRHLDENSANPQVETSSSAVDFENLMGIDQRGVDGVWVLVEAG